MIILKQYQEDSIQELLTKGNKLLNLGGNRVIVFESPTASGKTLMVSEFLKELVIDNKNKKKISFLWAAPRKLHSQSKKKLENYFQETNILNCVNFEDLQENKINVNEILFLNWESINKEKNIIIRENERDFYLDKVIENTKKDSDHLVLIIDESHHTATSEISKKLIADISADLTIEVSATPVVKNEDEKVKVYLEHVKQEGMVKNRVILNEGYKNELTKNQISSAANKGTDIMILEESLKKRKEIELAYKSLGKNINPLILIQLPDRKSKEEDFLLEQIIEFLNKEHNINTSNRKLSIYLSEDKKNLVNISKNDNEVEVLIFKQAISLGWDCPRAQVLALFRNWKSLNFSVQTIGRIMRMPEPNKGHYSEEILNQSYVYTNISNITLKEDVSNGYLSINTSRRSKETNLKLNSVYRKRLRGKTRLDTSFINIFLKEAKKYKLKDKLKKKDNSLNMSFLSETELLNHDEVTQLTQIKSNLSIENLNDLQKIFDYFIKDNLSPLFPEERSIKRLNLSIYKFFEKDLKISYQNEFDRLIKIVLDDQNNKYFKEVIEKSIQIYIDHHQKKQEGLSSIDNWNIPEQLSYFNEVSEFKQKKSIMQPLFLRDLSKPERMFIKYLESSSDVEWWYRNGEQDKVHFALPYTNEGNESPFYVDFIVSLKGKKVGFFDTKSGFTIQEAKTSGKIDGLNEFVQSDTNFLGGIVANTKKDQSGIWKIFKKHSKELTADNYQNWSDLDF